MSRPIRRVLSPRAVAPARVAAIHLRRTLPCASSGLPRSSGEQPSNAPCLALLPVGFAEPHRSPGALVVSCTTVSPLPRLSGPGPSGRGGLFSVALSRGSPRVGVTHHRALRSPDVPRRQWRTTLDATAWPTHPPDQGTPRRSVGVRAVGCAQMSVGIPTTATSRSPSCHIRTMLTEAGATRTEAHTDDDAPSVEPMAARIDTE